MSKPCKPGKEKNANGRCVLMCKEGQVRNDKGKCVSARARKKTTTTTRRKKAASKARSSSSKKHAYNDYLNIPDAYQYNDYLKGDHASYNYSMSAPIKINHDYDRNVRKAQQKELKPRNKHRKISRKASYEKRASENTRKRNEWNRKHDDAYGKWLF
jgi:hypothetical protein